MNNCENKFYKRIVESKHSLTANQFSKAGVSNLFFVLLVEYLNPASWDMG